MKLSIAACLLASCSVGAYDMLAERGYYEADADPLLNDGNAWSAERLADTPTLFESNSVVLSLIAVRRVQSECTDPVTLLLSVGGESISMEMDPQGQQTWDLALDVDPDQLAVKYSLVGCRVIFEIVVVLTVTSTSDPPLEPPSLPIAKIEEFIEETAKNRADYAEFNEDAPLTYSFEGKDAFFVVRCDWALTLGVKVSSGYVSVVGSDGSTYKSHYPIRTTFDVPCHAGSAVTVSVFPGPSAADRPDPMAEVHWSCDVCENPGTDPVTDKPLNTGECATDPCGLAQTCTDPDTSKDGDFVCTCDSDKDRSAVGERAVCVGVSECPLGNWPCPSGQWCRDDDEFVTGDFECYCLADVTRAQVGGPVESCDISDDECFLFPCGWDQYCSDPSLTEKGDFICSCDEDGKLSKVGGQMDSCPNDECLFDLCGEGQTCTDPDLTVSRNFICTCTSDTTKTWVGAAADCFTSYNDECDTNPCGAGQTCADPHMMLPKNYVCTCTSDTSLTAVASPANCDPSSPSSARDECTSRPCGTVQDCADPNTAKTGDFVCTCPDRATKAVAKQAVCPPSGTPSGTSTSNTASDECLAKPCPDGKYCADPSTKANDYICYSPTNSSPNGTDDDNGGTVLLIIIIAAAVLVLCLCALAGFCLIRRKNQPAAKTVHSYPPQQHHQQLPPPQQQQQQQQQQEMLLAEHSVVHNPMSPHPADVIPMYEASPLQDLLLASQKRPSRSLMSADSARHTPPEGRMGRSTTSLETGGMAPMPAMYPTGRSYPRSKERMEEVTSAMLMGRARGSSGSPRSVRGNRLAYI